MIELSGLSVTYGKVTAVDGVSLTAAEGEAVALIGANGAGKSSILKAILGLATSSGTICIDGFEISGLPSHRRVAQGVALSPEGRHVFPQMTVLENLEMGLAPAGNFEALVADMFELFPRLRERRLQMAGSMSGGEQQMLAIARALMSRPKVLMLDEPTLGLAPIIVEQIKTLIGILKERGMTVLLAEQNAEMALAASDRGYVLEMGRMIMSGRSADLVANTAIRSAYLGF